MELRNKSLIFNGKIVDIEQFDVAIGSKGFHTFQVIRHPGGAGVLPLHDDGTVTLIQQPRPAVDGITIEVPAGRLNPDEQPVECARRELIEETGLIPAELESLGYIYSSPGVFDEKIYLYIAKGLTQGESAQEQFEDIHPVRVSLEDAIQMVCDGRICDGKTIAALMRANVIIHR